MRLAGTGDVEMIQISGRTYAVVAARDDSGVQMMDLVSTPASRVHSDTLHYPSSPVPAITDGVGGFTGLDVARDVEAAQIASR